MKSTAALPGEVDMVINYPYTNGCHAPLTSIVGKPAFFLSPSNDVAVYPKLFAFLG